MRRLKRNRLLRQAIVQQVGPVQADRQRGGCGHDHDRGAGRNGGLGRANPPAPGIPRTAAIPEVLQMPEVP
jgi:hypothetical protein